jgi:hypothetical protein
MFYLLILQFCRKKHEKKLKITFLFVWDKGSCRGSFLVQVHLFFLHSTLVIFLW